MFSQKIKPIFIAKIYFEIDTFTTEHFVCLTKEYVKQLESELDKSYHVIVVPIMTTKINNEPIFEVFYPSDFKEIDLNELKKKFDDSIKSISENLIETNK